MIIIYQLQAVISWEGHQPGKNPLPVPVHFVNISVFATADAEEFAELTKRGKQSDSLYHFGADEPTEKDIKKYLEKGLSRGDQLVAKNIQFTEYSLQKVATAEKK